MTGAPDLHLWLIPLLPFAGFLANGLLGRKLPKPIVSLIALVATGAPFVLALNIAARFSSLTLPYVKTFAPWIQAGPFHADFAFSLDQLTLVMLLIVTGVGFLIHLYSIGYMAHEEGYWRYFAYLNLFMFFMLTLVLAENFLLVFVGWEGVGLASYLLIGFYFAKNSAANAGKKAFIVNRIGDFGFLLAMFLTIAHFGTLSFHEVFAQIAQHPEAHGGYLTAIALFLILGATGKSAQIPLYIWLPDAMEGPTPVSALIHAATMVTAGVYMTVRCHAIFDRSPLALSVIAVIGAATAFFAATVGVVQTDIKRVLAYSTISQLGYMFLACGVAAYSAGVFHLLTHAFFKALLFLAAGSVIHALNGEQDMRVMGGLRSKIPLTFATMTAGVLAIAGIPPFAGFVSKDEILYRVYASGGIGPILWFVGLVTAFLTSFYMFRLWYLTFWGESRAHDHAHEAGHGHGGHGVHESGGMMLVPLAALALLSIVGGWVGWPESLWGANWFGHFLDPVISAQHLSFGQVAVAMNNGSTAGAAASAEGGKALEYSLMAISILTALAGWLSAYFLYLRKPELPGKLAKQFGAAYSLLVNKYWIDELYNAVVVRPLNVFARIGLWWTVDRGIVDGSAYVAAGTAMGLGAIVRRVQSGNIRSYAGWLAGGAAALLLLMYFGYHPYAQVVNLYIGKLK
jgi:NADH-quinone oxidoreductase subunit L